MLKALRNAFFSGLLLLAPVAVTIFVINFLVDRIGTPTRAIFFPFLQDQLQRTPWIAGGLSIVSTFIVLILITILGWFSQLVIGRFLVNLAEKILTRLPFIKTVYNTVKQIIDTFTQQKKAVFQKCVLIEFPRRGMYAMGFLTGKGKGEVQAKTARTICNIFLPTTPNPTSGYLIMVPEEDVLELKMSVADGMKLIISGGAVVPVYDSENDTDVPIAFQNPTEGAQFDDEAAPVAESTSSQLH